MSTTIKVISSPCCNRAVNCKIKRMLVHTFEVHVHYRKLSVHKKVAIHPLVLSECVCDGAVFVSVCVGKTLYTTIYTLS